VKERITLTEAEDKVERNTGVPETAEEMVERLAGLSLQFPPPYILGLFAIRMGGELLKMAEHSCLDCENPACFGKPQHQQFIRELLLDKLPEIEVMIAELQEQVTQVVYHITNCDCEYCEAKDKKDAAKFN
jgi:hypothetical protein